MFYVKTHTPTVSVRTYVPINRFNNLLSDFFNVRSKKIYANNILNRLFC